MANVSEGKIIEKFNDAVKEIQNAYESSYKKDIGGAQKHLENSAIAIYQALEWIVKNLLLQQFSNPVLHKHEIEIIEGSSFPAKLNLFEKKAIPFDTSIKVNFKLIKELKSPVRNNTEHSGFTPHFNSLKQVVVETEKIIHNFIDKNASLEKLPEVTVVENESSSHWTEFLEACDSFNSERNFILIIGPNNKLDSEKLEPLGLIDWSLILDFDPETEISGLFKHASKELGAKRKIHLITNQDSSSTFSPNRATYWIASNGLKGRSATLATNFREWSFKYTGFLQKLLTNYYSSLGHRPTTVVVLWNNQQYVQKGCEILYNIFANSIQFVYSHSNVIDLAPVYDNYEGRVVELSLPEISEGILKIKKFFSPTVEKDSIALPSKDDKYVNIDKTDFHWIEEDLEVVHKNILDSGDFSQSKVEFLKGKQITWGGLHLNFDAERELMPQLKKNLEKNLSERRISLLFLNHYPGIGGTTLGRRLAWEIHNSYPTLVLRKFRVQETTNRVYKIFELTKLTPFILADSSTVSYDELERLLNEIKSRNFPAVILLVQRNNDHIQSRKVVFLPGILTDLEFMTFVEFYAGEAPQKKELFTTIKNNGNNKEKHPFYLGLVAFENEFYGLSEFVSKGLSEANEIQKKIVGLISLSYIYAQQGLSAQLLSGLLMTEENRIIKLERHLPGSLLHLLINTEELKWQPIHYLVGKELLIQVLSGGSANKDVWRQSLPEISIELIKTISAKSIITSEADMELLRRLFIYRDNQEILGKEGNLFSNLIEEGLLSDEARLRIFRQLTESFPSESHFWGHLARFYNIRMHNNDEALTAVNKAIELSEEKDHLLFHMKGMCLRGKAYEIISRWKGNKNCPTDKREEIINLVEESGDSFRQCRELNPSNEHGYISHVQMIIQSLDFSFSVSNYTSRTDFLRNLTNWNRQLLDEAESLLDQVKRVNRDNSDHAYIKKCDIGLQELYEDYSAVIEGWNNLLSSKDTFKPPVRRQIVRAYVRRASSWNNISEKDIEKMLKLIEINIQEEPTNESNINLWFQCARQLSSIDVNMAIDKIANWRANSNSLDASYYLGVLHSIQSINNTAVSKIKAEQLIKETSERSRTLPNRTYCFEWFGQLGGLKALTPSHEAISRDENQEIVLNSNSLKLVRGKISMIKGPEAGNIELECGLSAFFVPAREGFVKDRDRNQDVQFYIGFSYDGLRAWGVKPRSK
ncbi:hypothetical protein WSM22_20960 [Cytophagales bacterium WSM2-2]|nr:hypothetical protein WSM22_20960 [Cytophagales bacterium WSM2-2]